MRFPFTLMGIMSLVLGVWIIVFGTLIALVPNLPAALATPRRSTPDAAASLQSGNGSNGAGRPQPDEVKVGE